MQFAANATVGMIATTMVQTPFETSPISAKALLHL